MAGLSVESVVVKGCRTSAVTRWLRRARTAGVGQASREETAGGLGAAVRPVRALASLDAVVKLADADEEAVSFLIAARKAKIWRDVFNNEDHAVRAVEAYSGGDYAERVKHEFLSEYHNAKKLQIPDGYAFAREGVPAWPNLMQRLIASGILPMGSRRRRLLNQSTHSSVANSTASQVRHGPRRWITSVLNSPITVSARALS